MNITKCDICEKEIKGKMITVGEGYFPRLEFCSDCAGPISDFLKKNGFIFEDKKKKSGS